jgi:dihydroxyacetone kinase-like protein
MSQSPLDIANLFGTALNAVNDNREQLNSMDETSHPNHGDNVAHNLGIIKSTMESQQSQTPSDAMRLAAQRLNEQGRGSTAPQYAQGLQQAANQFQGQQSLSNEDMGLLLHNMLGASSQGQTAQQLGGMQGMPGVLSGRTQQAAGGNDLVSKLAPAAMEFMRAKASGSSTQSAAMQAAMRAMMGGNPLQASTPGGASGGLIAQSIMKSLMG